MCYEFPALRQGEKGRTCAKCGRAFEPKARTQKYCPDCGYSRISKPHAAPKKNSKVKEVERHMDTTTFGLNDALFKELYRIDECETPEEIEAEAVRAGKVCDLASCIVQNGKLMLSAAQMSMDVAGSVNVPRALLGMGDGK